MFSFIIWCMCKQIKSLIWSPDHVQLRRWVFDEIPRSQELFFFFFFFFFNEIIIICVTADVLWHDVMLMLMYVDEMLMRCWCYVDVMLMRCWCDVDVTGPLPREEDPAVHRRAGPDRGHWRCRRQRGRDHPEARHGHAGAGSFCDLSPRSLALTFFYGHGVNICCGAGAGAGVGTMTGVQCSSSQASWAWAIFLPVRRRIKKERKEKKNSQNEIWLTFIVGR